MSYSEEHLDDVVQHQLLEAIASSHVRSPVKLGEYMRRELQENEQKYPGTIEAAWHKLHPDPEYVDPGLYVAIDFPTSDVEVGRTAIAEFREHMGWTRPAKVDRLEASHGDVRGFTRPELHLVMPDLEPDENEEENDVTISDDTITINRAGVYHVTTTAPDPDDDPDDDAFWNQEPA